MSIFDRAKEHAKSAVRSVVRLPVIDEAVLDDGTRERQAAKAGLVPKRCGLCRHFSREAFLQVAQLNPPFAEAMKYARPGQMAGRKGAAPRFVSEEQLELRPRLTEEWSDYGVCTHFIDPDDPAGRGGAHVAIWGYWEQPEMPYVTESGKRIDKPCEEWR